jgi:hypothetical protein
MTRMHLFFADRPHCDSERRRRVFRTMLFRWRMAAIRAGDAAVFLRRYFPVEGKPWLLEGGGADGDVVVPQALKLLAEVELGLHPDGRQGAGRAALGPLNAAVGYVDSPALGEAQTAALALAARHDAVLDHFGWRDAVRPVVRAWGGNRLVMADAPKLLGDDTPVLLAEVGPRGPNVQLWPYRPDGWPWRWPAPPPAPCGLLRGLRRAAGLAGKLAGRLDRAMYKSRCACDICARRPGEALPPASEGTPGPVGERTRSARPRKKALSAGAVNFLDAVAAKPLTYAAVARKTGLNPDYVRQLAGRLQGRGLIVHGAAGYELTDAGRRARAV